MTKFSQNNPHGYCLLIYPEARYCFSSAIDSINFVPFYGLALLCDNALTGEMQPMVKFLLNYLEILTINVYLIFAIVEICQYFS